MRYTVHLNLEITDIEADDEIAALVQAKEILGDLPESATINHIQAQRIQS